MKILLWHCSELRYVDTKISTRPLGIHRFRPPLASDHFTDVLVAFVCVESPDSTDAAEAAAYEIAALADMVRPKNGIVIVPFAHLSSDLADPQTARSVIGRVAGKLGDNTPKVPVASFGTHKNFYLQSFLAYGHAGSVAFREIPVPTKHGQHPDPKST
jgi:hypothetical protein